MDSEKGNMDFAGGNNVSPPPPWFMEHKRTLVGIGLTRKLAQGALKKSVTSKNGDGGPTLLIAVVTVSSI